MAKLIILSIVLMTFGVPIYLASKPRPLANLRRVQWILFTFIFLWAYMCTRWYPAIVELK
jgi:hypothetical protein